MHLLSILPGGWAHGHEFFDVWSSAFDNLRQCGFGAVGHRVGINFVCDGTRDRLTEIVEPADSTIESLQCRFQATCFLQRRCSVASDREAKDPRHFLQRIA